MKNANLTPTLANLAKLANSAVERVKQSSTSRAEEPADLCECDAERAAIMEHDGGLARAEAEAATREYRHVRCINCMNWNNTPRCAAGMTTSHPDYLRLCGTHFRERGVSEGREAGGAR